MNDSYDWKRIRINDFFTSYVAADVDIELYVKGWRKKTPVYYRSQGFVVFTMHSYQYTDSATIKDGVAIIDEFFDCDAPIIRRRGDLNLSLLSTIWEPL